MTERSPAKIKRAVDSRAPRKAASGAAETTEVARLKAQIARLEDELAAAQAQIAGHEKRESDALNRIDWVIDSLHNISDKF